MTTTTLCYIENKGKYLMLHRVKKKNDINEGKWIGVGGHVEYQESPEECLVREGRDRAYTYLVSVPWCGDIYQRYLRSGTDVRVHSGWIHRGTDRMR